MAKHKTLGQVYTPKWIVNEILDLVNYKGKHILEKYVLEPSSGDGAFLLEIIDRYINACLENNFANDEIIERLGKYIYAIEIDKIEFNKSINNLNEFVKIKLQTEKKVNWNIFNDNTLYLYKNYLKFFDFIVGNPPYIRIHNLDLETRELLKKEFIFSEGTIGIYLSFFEMSFKMLKNNAFLGFITPNSYLHNSSYNLFRNYLKQEATLKTLIDFKSNKIFNGFSTYTAISIFQIGNIENSFVYKELIDNKISYVNHIKFVDLNDKDWSFTNKENIEFLRKLNFDRNVAIKDFFDVQYGFATLRDKIYISKIEKYNDKLVFFNDSFIEKAILKKVIKGTRLKGELNNCEMILFPYELINGRYIVIEEDKMKQDYPYAYEYLSKHREELESRDIDKGALWYEFGRSQGIQTIHNEKIVLSTLINGEIECYRVPADVMMYSGLFIIKNKPFADWSIVENTLKSEEFYKYIRLTGKDFSGGYKSITSKQIKEYKIKFKNPESLF